MYSYIYRNILAKYWRQFNSLYEIPKGFHVHHIVPQSVAKNKGWTEKQINSPKNLIALHPDDHISIHLNRGDTYMNGCWITTKSDQYGKNNPFYGKHHSDETKKILSQKLKGRNRTDQFKQNVTGKNNPFYGKKHTDIMLDKMKNTYYKNNKPIKCKYCDFVHTNKGNLNRWHNDNCKHKPQL